MSTVEEIKNHYFKSLIKRNGARDNSPFRLDDHFVEQYVNRPAPFGFSGIGEFVFYRTYSRTKDDGSKETFVDTLRRVVEGCYEIQRRHCDGMHISWTRSKAQASAQEMFDRMWHLKFLPPGRGLWAMGTPFMWERGSGCLQNCGFISTANIVDRPGYPFYFMTDMSMLGVGVGFDTRGANKLRVKHPVQPPVYFEIPDSREGWAESVCALVESFAHGSNEIIFVYDKIRRAGTPIKGFGGKASGPGPLRFMHDNIRNLLAEIASRPDPVLTSVGIVDLMNFIGVCVVAGQVRRSSQISFGSYNDNAYVSIKDPLLYPSQLQSHRWVSNNSIFADVGMDYTRVAEQIAMNGEPGLLWLDNIRNYGRMKDGFKRGIDAAIGANPCVEQSLEDSELCNLVETFPVYHDSVEDYHRTLKFAYLYAKTVTLLPTHCRDTNSVLLRNRRIGLSQSGIVQAFHKFGRRKMLQLFCDDGYGVIDMWDAIYSKWLCVGRSIKKTSVKPSGTTSLVATSEMYPQITPGIHYTPAPTRTYWRNVRVGANSSLVGAALDAGYYVEQSVNDPKTVIIRFGISDPNTPCISEVSIWNQVKTCVDMQHYWSDNQVSCTVQFKKDEVGEIPKVLEAFDDQLKGISFLPIEDHGYPQAPYQPATEREVAEYNARLKPIDHHALREDGVGSVFCDNDKCQISQ